jgi:chromosome partitioning protein
MEQMPQAPGGQLPPIHPDWDGDDDINERSTIADIFYGKAVLPFSTYISKENGFKGSVDIMLSHPQLMEEINNKFDKTSGLLETKVIKQMQTFLHMPEIGEMYDVVLIDTGPSRSPIFRSALRAATHLIFPFECEEKSLQGISAMLQIMESENFSRNAEEQVQLLGFLPNKIRKVKLHTSTLDQLYERLPTKMFPRDIYMPLSIHLPERDLKGINPRSIYDMRKDLTAVKHAVKVGRYVHDKLFTKKDAK